MPAADFEPPRWIQQNAQTYKQWLQRQAVLITKHDRKRGGIYRVKDAMDAIHAAAHRSDGIDPYDGRPMEGSLLGPNKSTSNNIGAQKQTSDQRRPTVKHTRGALICDFEIMSLQTAKSKGTMTAEDYLEHCRAVVRFRGDPNTSNNSI